MSDTEKPNYGSLRARQEELGLEISTNAQFFKGGMNIQRNLHKKFEGNDVLQEFSAGPGSARYEPKVMTKDNWGPWNVTDAGLALSFDKESTGYIISYLTQVGRDDAKGRLEYVLATKDGVTKGYVVSGGMKPYPDEAHGINYYNVGAKEIDPRVAALAIRKGFESIADAEEFVAQKSGKPGIRKEMMDRGASLPELLQAFLPPEQRTMQDLPGGYGDAPNHNLPAKPAAPRQK